MLIHCPELTADQIAEWMRAAAARPAATQAGGRSFAERTMRNHHPGFDFKKTREALNRARTKTEVHTIKPLQRLRRNQGAVNEGFDYLLVKTLDCPRPNRRRPANRVSQRGYRALRAAQA